MIQVLARLAPALTMLAVGLRAPEFAGWMLR